MLSLLEKRRMRASNLYCISLTILIFIFIFVSFPIFLVNNDHFFFTNHFQPSYAVKDPNSISLTPLQFKKMKCIPIFFLLFLCFLNTVKINWKRRKIDTKFKISWSSSILTAINLIKARLSLFELVVQSCKQSQLTFVVQFLWRNAHQYIYKYTFCLPSLRIFFEKNNHINYLYIKFANNVFLNYFWDLKASLKSISTLINWLFMNLRTCVSIENILEIII